MNYNKENMVCSEGSVRELAADIMLSIPELDMLHGDKYYDREDKLVEMISDFLKKRFANEE